MIIAFNGLYGIILSLVLLFTHGYSKEKNHFDIFPPVLIYVWHRCAGSTVITKFSCIIAVYPALLITLQLLTRVTLRVTITMIKSYAHKGLIECYFRKEDRSYEKKTDSSGKCIS